MTGDEYDTILFHVGDEYDTLKKIYQMFYQRKEEKTMTNNKIMNNTDNLEATITAIKATQEKDIMCVCDDIVVTIPEVEKLLQNEDTKDTALKLLAIMWKTSGEPEATAGTPEATKKPTVGEVMDIEKKYREVIFNDLVQSAVFCDGGQTSEEYEEKRMDAMSAWKNLEAHLGDDKEGHKLYDEYMTKVNVAVSTLLCDVYRKALHDSLTISETLELCQWFEKTKTDFIFDGLPTI